MSVCIFFSVIKTRETLKWVYMKTHIAQFRLLHKCIPKKKLVSGIFWSPWLRDTVLWISIVFLLKYSEHRALYKGILSNNGTRHQARGTEHGAWSTEHAVDTLTGSPMGPASPFSPRSPCNNHVGTWVEGTLTLEHIDLCLSTLGFTRKVND